MLKSVDFSKLEEQEAQYNAKQAKKTKREKVMQVLNQKGGGGSSSSSSSSDRSARQQEDEEEKEEQEEDEIFLGRARGVIKGVQHYQGVAHAGEYVILRREPTNVYDSNALEVLNLANQRIGHIAKETASVLASIIDRKLIDIEATIPRPSGVYQQDVDLAFYVTAQNAPAVREHLQRHRFNLLTNVPVPVQSQSYSQSAAASVAYGPGGYNRLVPQAKPVPKIQAAPKAAVTATKMVTSGASSQKSLEEILDSIGGNKYEPIDQAAICGPVLTSQLFAHQLEGVSFLIARENDIGLPPFWSQAVENGKTVFINTITNSSQSKPPPSVKGGLLADDMGLGKSLMIIALVLSNPPKGQPAMTPGCQRAAHRAAQDAKRAEGWDAMSGIELQQACRQVKINQMGTKTELVEKLVAKHMHDHSARDAPTAGQPKTTLIVCPVSVISGWMDQLDAHLATHSAKIYNYSGAGRMADTDFLSSFDFVLVSYSTLANELSKGPPEVVGNKRARESQGLFNVTFWRVILDESHTVRNRATKMFGAVSKLQATNCWCISGTPIQNKADDAYPIFSFLKAEPCNDWAVFNRAVSRPIKNCDIEGITRLRAFLSSLSLRRNKDIIKHHLPKRTIEVHAIKMSAEQRERYESIFKSAQLVVGLALQAQEGNMSGLYSGVLECILRLRQVCCDSSLIPPDRIAAAAAVLGKYGKTSGKAAAPLTPEEASRLFSTLQGVLSAPEDNDCCVCLDPLTEDKLRLLRSCRHTLCEDCCNKLLVQKVAEKVACPLCRMQFVKSDVLEADKVREAAAENDIDGAGGKPKGDGEGKDEGDKDENMPPKIIALLQGLQAMRTEDPAQKAVVFSQFTSYLNLIGKHLKKAGLGFARLDGSMSQKMRGEKLAGWRDSNAAGGASVLIISTRAGGQGLNLCEGNRVFLMDPLWNSAAEEQAMDRVYRLGQKRDVTVVRFVHEDSVEEKILKLQESKAAINKGALSKLSEEEVKNARLKEMITLFEL